MLRPVHEVRPTQEPPVVEYVCNWMTAGADPTGWARRREAEGWHFVSVADHFFTSTRPFPHVWVTCGAIAAATSTIGITTAFVNNLFRNPVEVAQAAIAMAHLAPGRFELGVGAGWARHELEEAGMAYPPRGERAGRYAEAMQIIRSLVHTGAADVDGDHYSVHTDRLGPVPEAPPPIVGSVGGPRTIREVTPHCDRIELKAASPATRDGEVDFAAMAAIGDDHLLDLIERARAVDPDIELGMFVLCNAGDDPMTRALEKQLAGSLYGRFYGEPAKVADGLAWLGELGITRCQLSPFDDASLDRLAPILL